eukprot:6323569-Alexandrium_andersonii.AAC.1
MVVPIPLSLRLGSGYFWRVAICHSWASVLVQNHSYPVLAADGVTQVVQQHRAALARGRELAREVTTLKQQLRKQQVCQSA